MNNAVKFVVALFTLTLPGWINYQKNDPQPKHKEMDIYNQKQLNKEVDNWENMEMEKNTVLERVKNKTKPETKMNSENLKLMDELLFTPTFNTLSGSFPLGTVVILLLIHTCGADLVAAASAVCLYIFSAAGFFNVVFGFITPCYLHKRKAELEKTKSKLQNDLKMKEQDHNDVTNALSETKTKLETWKNDLMQELEDVESKIKENKENLQSVEKEIRQKETEFDKPAALITEKENLLKDQWELDKTKKHVERQLLKTEKLMEPLENWIMKKTNT